jgi:hypothetical protein
MAEIQRMLDEILRRLTPEVVAEIQRRQHGE